MNVTSVDLKLGNYEAELLRRVLISYVSDLRMEIADTDNYDMRQGLKSDEEVLKGIIARLGGPA